MSADVDGITRGLQRWAAAINARRVDAVLDLVSDDVVFAQPQGPTYAGKAAVHWLYRAAFRTYDVNERLQCDDIRVVGKLAMVRVTVRITLTPKTGGGAIAFIEQDAIRFRRHPNGEWKIVSRSHLGPSASLSTFARLANLSPRSVKARPPHS